MGGSIETCRPAMTIQGKRRYAQPAAEPARRDHVKLMTYVQFSHN